MNKAAKIGRRSLGVFLAAACFVIGVAFLQSGQKAGAALLDKLAGFFDDLSRTPPPATVIVQTLAGFRTEATRTFEAKEISRPFFDRYTRVLTVIGLVAGTDPANSDRDKIEKDIERFVLDVTGKGWTPDTGVSEKIGSFSAAVAAEVAALRLLLGGPATDRESAGDDVAMAGESIAPPRLIKSVDPVYPPIAYAARVQGIVFLEVRIDVQGRVKDVKIVQSIPLLDQAAIDAVRQYLYEPYTAGGQAKEIILTVKVTFALK